MLQRAATARRLHTAAAADPTPAIYDYAPKTRVMTCDGHPGVVLAVVDGPYPGTETYDVRLDGGMGGGSYLAGQLQPLPGARTAGTAAADYPELAQVLVEHPDPARGRIARRLGSSDDDLSGLSYCTACGKDGHSEKGCPAINGAHWLLRRMEGKAEANGHFMSSPTSHSDHGGSPWQLGLPFHHFRSYCYGCGADLKTHAGGESGSKSPRLDRGCPEPSLGQLEAARRGRTADPARGSVVRTAALQTDAMPSRNHPAPGGFYTRTFWDDGSEMTPREIDNEHQTHPEWCEDGDCDGFERRVMKGYDPSHPMHPQPVSRLSYHLSRCGHKALVGMLETDPNARERGYGSALMDHLYARHPEAEIDHGERTPEGVSWWSSYDDPDPSRSSGGHPVAAMVHTAAAAALQPAYSAAMASVSDFDREYQQARDVKFHDRMSGYMNSNGHRMQPVGDEVTSGTSLDSTCPDCGAYLSTGDGTQVYDGHGRLAPMGLDTPCGTDGRRTPVGDRAYEPDGQPIEQSIGSACKNCGTPMGHDAQRFGCVFCTSGDHHGYCCPTLGASHTAAAEMTLGETIVPNHTPGPGPTKPHSPQDNPASSGWASAPDPDQWSAAPLYPLDSRVGAAAQEPEDTAGVEATLHDEPQAALPSTDGSDLDADSADPEALTPQSFTAILAAFHAANPDMDPGRSGRAPGAPDGDIAAAAQAHLAGLSKTSAYDFTPGQRRALIEEGASVGARAANADRLDLSGTHYADTSAVSDAEDEEGDSSWWT